jgi:prepilin peptidase CpaA
MIRVTVLQFLPVFAALSWAAVQDVRTRRIPNVLTFALALSGLAQSFLATGTVGPWASSGGLALGFGLGLGLFVLGGMGGGDVKLLAGLGAWTGPWGVVAIVVIEKVLAMLFVVGAAAWDGRLTRLLQSTAGLASNMLTVREQGVTGAVEASRMHVSVGRPLPYAVPVLVASAVTIVFRIGV